MTCTINASTTNNLQVSADGSGIVKLQSNGVTTNALAWVRFNSTTGAAVVTSSYNISSITYTSAGIYTLNFTNALSDANYSLAGSAYYPATYIGVLGINGSPTTSSCPIATYVATNGTAQNMPYICCVIFGN